MTDSEDAASRRLERFDIRVCEPDDAELRAAVFALRYQVAVDEMGKRPAEADHDRRWLSDTLDDDRSTLLVALLEGEPVATIRLTWGEGIPPGYRAIFGLDDFGAFAAAQLSVTSRLVVAATWRGSTVLGQLLNAIFSLARERGVRINFCNCAPSLVRLYEQLGYRRYRHGYVDEALGYQVPLVMLTEDLEHLRRIRSPFYRVARRFEAKQDTAAWYARQFPEYAAAPTWGTPESGDIIATLAQRLFETGIPLFRGLSAEATEAFLQAATVLDCRAGDALVRQGDVGAEMYLVLEGAAEVVREVGGCHYPVASIGEGQIFGEMAFLSSRKRSASVIAATELRVLVLTQRFLKRVMHTLPETVIQVLFNLSVTLCDRLDLSTERWLSSVSQAEQTQPQPQME